MRDTVITVPGLEVERASVTGTRRRAGRGYSCLMVLAILTGACGGTEQGTGGIVPAPVTVQINGPGQLIPPGQTQFTAVQTWSDGSTVDVTSSAQWTSTSPSVLSIGAGLATALAPGETGVTARFEQYVSQRKTVLVLPAFPEWNGTYALTIGGGAAVPCIGPMPPELKQRTFTANVGQSGLMLTVDVPNAGSFSGRIFNPQVRFSLYSGSQLSARRARKRSAGWVLPERSWGVATSEPRLRLAYGPGGGPSPTPLIVEVLPDGNRLSIGGDAVTTMSPSGFTGTLSGEVTLLHRDTGNPLAICSSPSHVFTLVRK